MDRYVAAITDSDHNKIPIGNDSCHSKHLGKLNVRVEITGQRLLYRASCCLF